MAGYILARRILFFCSALCVAFAARLVTLGEGNEALNYQIISSLFLGLGLGAVASSFLFKDSVIESLKTSYNPVWATICFAIAIAFAILNMVVDHHLTSCIAIVLNWAFLTIGWTLISYSAAIKSYENNT